MTFPLRIRWDGYGIISNRISQMYPYHIFPRYRADPCPSHEPLYSRRCPAYIWAGTEILRWGLWIHLLVSPDPDSPRRDSGLRTVWRQPRMVCRGPAFIIVPHAQQPERRHWERPHHASHDTPEGNRFEPLTQWDIRKAVNHINSVPRGNLSGETPYRPALKNMAPIYSRPGSLHSSFQMKWYCHPRCRKIKSLKKPPAGNYLFKSICGI